MANEKTGTLQFRASDGSYVAGYPKTTLAQVIGGQNAIDAAITTAGTNADAKYPKKDGTGATGSWGIDITGKATTAGTADTAKACSGNAATATKLAAARTVTLSGDATGSATFDGSANITVPVTFTRTDGLTSLCPDGAAAHNCFYRGKDITADFTSGKMSTNIANGTFKDIFVGDYIDKGLTVNGTSIGTVRWRVGECDYYYRSGDSPCNTHHVLMVPDDVLDVNIRMNDTNNATGGYQGTEMWKTTLPLYTDAIKAAFGTGHVLDHRELLTKAISADAPSGAGAGWTGSATDWDWQTVSANLFNEVMVYGTRVFSSSAFDVGNGKKQVALFALNHESTIAGYRGNHSDRKWYWLRAVASASLFVRADHYGGAAYTDASIRADWGGVRPYFLLR